MKLFVTISPNITRNRKCNCKGCICSDSCKQTKAGLNQAIAIAVIVADLQFKLLPAIEKNVKKNSSVVEMGS